MATLPSILTGPQPTRTILPHANKLLVNNKISVSPVDLGNSLKALQDQNDGQAIFNRALVGYLQGQTTPAPPAPVSTSGIIAYQN
jgi:hypothetical protein